MPSRRRRRPASASARSAASPTDLPSHQRSLSTAVIASRGMRVSRSGTHWRKRSSPAVQHEPAVAAHLALAARLQAEPLHVLAALGGAADLRLHLRLQRRAAPRAQRATGNMATEQDQRRRKREDRDRDFDRRTTDLERGHECSRTVCARAQPVRAARGPARAHAVPLQGQAAAAPVKAQLKQGGFWHKGCPVGLDGLRLLTVRHWGWDGRAHTGQLIVNARAAQPLRRVFRKLYGLHFPIRHMQLDDFYGPKRERPKDVTASFECRQAVPSPCTGGKGTGTWSQHAYGLAVDVNPNENPYVGCGQSRDPTLRRYRNRSRHLKGMVTPARHPGLRLDRLGLGRRVGGQHQGLHALLLDRRLSSVVAVDHAHVERQHQRAA